MWVINLIETNVPSKTVEGEVMDRFKDKYLSGEVEFEAIDDYSYEWGMSEEECTLAQFLGLNEEEEDTWISVGEDALKEMLDAQRRM